MFKKPIAQLKTFSPLRSSDRRRFQNEAYENYPNLKDQPVMPDDLRSAKFTSHLGVAGVIYVADNHQPLWLSFENLPPIPTVYTTWRYPNMLPILYTWSPVIQKLIEGADLMIPGLVPGPTGVLPNLAQGDLVAITVKGYSYPLAIGTMALPTSEIRPRSGMKGKAVHIVHVFQDFLWSMGDKSEPPEMPQESDESDYEEEKTDVEPTESTEQVKVVEEESIRQLSTEEVDDILKTSFYYALVYKVTPNNSILPISASSFYSAYIMPSRPIGAESAEIKRSSWKKLQKFIKVIEKSGLLKSKEQRGETMIISIQWSHPALQDVAKYKTLDHQPTPASAPAQKKTDESKSAEIQELFKPTGSNVYTFFDQAHQDKDALYTFTELRTIMNDYVKAQELANPKNQKMIRLDAILCDALLSKAEYKTVDQLARDQLVNRLISKMQPFHTILLPGQKEPLLRKGHPKPVEIVQEIRQGRKTVTKVTGVEAFNLDIEDLIKDFTKLCASSVTSNPIHGVSPKNPLFEIMVQGPQIKNITEFLLNKGVPKKLIESTDKTQKNKKKK